MMVVGRVEPTSLLDLGALLLCIPLVQLGSRTGMTMDVEVALPWLVVIGHVAWPGRA
jgi:hypothetical protein